MYYETKTILWLFQIIAFITVAFLWQKNKNDKHNGFFYFMIYVLLAEVCTVITTYVTGNENQLLKNILTVTTGLFFLYWFHSILKQKRVVQFLGFIFLSPLIISVYKEGLYQQLWDTLISTITISIIICSILFYSNLLINTKKRFFKIEPQFWVTTGLTIFYIGFLLMNVFENYLITNEVNLNIILVLLGSYMYGCFIIGFLSPSKKTNNNL